MTTAMSETKFKVADSRQQHVIPASSDDYKTTGHPFVDNPKMDMRGVNVYYGEKQAIFNVSLDIAENEVLAMIGPSGCGKSTFLRALNRMNDTVDSCRVEGQLNLDK